MAQTVRNKVAWVVFVFLAIGIGFYPLIYLFATEEFGLLLSKSNEVLSNEVWRIAFYGHISFGGIALLSGWSQFIKKLRAKHLNLHRNLGRVYVFLPWSVGCAVFTLVFLPLEVLFLPWGL